MSAFMYISEKGIYYSGEGESLWASSSKFDWTRWILRFHATKSFNFCFKLFYKLFKNKQTTSEEIKQNETLTTTPTRPACWNTACSSDLTAVQMLVTYIGYSDSRLHEEHNRGYFAWIIGVYFAVVGRNGWTVTVCGLCLKTKALINVLSHPWRKHLISYSSCSHNPYPQWSSMCCEYLNIVFKTLKYPFFSNFCTVTPNCFHIS